MGSSARVTGVNFIDLIKHRGHQCLGGQEYAKTPMSFSAKSDGCPDLFQKGKPCVYVGSTGISVEERFKQHVFGKKSKKGKSLSNKYVRKYGKRLRYNDIKNIRPRKTRLSIEKKEAEVAKGLQLKGWAVWWG